MTAKKIIGCVLLFIVAIPPILIVGWAIWRVPAILVILIWFILLIVALELIGN